MDKKIRALNQGLKTLILLELIGTSIISYFVEKVKEKRWKKKRAKWGDLQTLKKI